MEEKKKDNIIEIPHGEVAEIPIFYTNDLHGELEKFGSIATIVRKKQKEGEKFLLFDAGDFASGTQVANTHKGKPMVELFNISPYDAIGLGEGELMFDAEGLKHIVEELKPPVLCANLYVRNEARLFPGVKPFIIKEFADIKFAVTSLINGRAINLARENTNSPLPGLDTIEIRPHNEVMKEILEEVKKEGAQKIILLSHLGIDSDSSLAAAFPEIDVIISGHSHSQLLQPVMVKNTFIVSSGSGGNYLGSLTLNIADVISLKMSK